MEEGTEEALETNAMIAEKSGEVVDFAALQQALRVDFVKVVRAIDASAFSDGLAQVSSTI